MTKDQKNTYSQLYGFEFVSVMYFSAAAGGGANGAPVPMMADSTV